MTKNNLKYHFTNLYLIALSDGRFDKEELDMILEIASEKGISQAEFEEIITNPTEAYFEMPDNFLDKIKLLYDFTRVILADGIIDPDEKRIFMRLCSNYDFKQEESEELFEWLIELAKKNLPINEIDNELRTLIN